MNTSQQIASQLRAVYFGGNWTWSTLKEHLSDVSWQQATTKINGFNTIAALVFHINYFVVVVIKVLQGGPLDAKDIYSFDCPDILSPEDWEAFLAKTWEEAETLAQLIEQMDEQLLGQVFKEEKYGNYYRNLHGVIEHAHYHLGQIVLLKKLTA